MWELSRYQLSVVAFSSSWVYFYQFVGTWLDIERYHRICCRRLLWILEEEKKIQLNFLWEAHSSWHFLSGEWSPPIGLSLPVSSGNVIEIQMQMFVYTHCQELTELLGDSWPACHCYSQWRRMHVTVWEVAYDSRKVMTALILSHFLHTVFEEFICHLINMLSCGFCGCSASR